jgi:hypothetical protein
MAMLNITLRRTGDRLLQFTGQVIATVSSRNIAGTESDCWHEVELYITAGGKYVVAVGYRTGRNGELPNDEAVVLDTEDDVAEYLKNDIDPTEHLAFHQPDLQPREDGERIRKDLTVRYRAAVSRILGSVGPEKIET